MRVRQKIERLEVQAEQTRLQRLAEGALDTVCPSCRDRSGRMLLVTERRPADGKRLPQESQKAPEPCSQCGQVPEGIIRVAEVLVETREQADEVLSEQNVDRDPWGLLPSENRVKKQPGLPPQER
jgi:hypothetical protein